jgi:MFS family permease
MALFRTLTHRPFALLWGGQAISGLGDAIYLIALAWWVLQATYSATSMGAVLIFTTVPTLLLLLVGGIASDRLPRLWLMLGSDLAGGALSGAVALLAALHLLALWHIFLISAVFGTVTAFFYPAYSAVVPEIVPADDLPSANSLTRLASPVRRTPRAAIGAALVALGGTSLAFALDAVSFFLSAACIVAVARLAALHRIGERENSVLGDLREGLGTVTRTGWIWVTIVVAGVSNITMSGPQETVLPFLVRGNLHAGVAIYGLLRSLEAAGSVVVAIWLGRRAPLRHRGFVMYGAWLLAAIMLFAMGLPVGVGGVGLAIAVWGASIAILELVWVNALQERVPAELLGRISSVDALGSYALLPVGYGIAGIAADHIGAATVFLVGGAISAALIGLGLVHPSVRQLD